MGLESLKARLKGYRALYTLPNDADKEEHREAKLSSAWRLVLATLPGLVLAAVVCSVFFATMASVRRPAPSACTDPTIRQEWRALTRAEKREFIRAVNVLAQVPSRWRENGTVYDDFAVLHGAIGSWAHRSASFLPWHRYTLILYEAALREHAGFKGHIPYWDWSLDWMDLANSSIWSSDDGFGGDGDPSGPIVVGDGRCLLDGPFAHLRPILYNHTFTQHCLARGFHDGETMGRLSGEAYKPEKMGEILREPTYKGFARQLEIYLHGSLHQSVNGDFQAMTAANDPLFYVHHAQLDRVWWRWQQMRPGVRLFEYEGKHMFNSTGHASLDDVLLYGGFAEDMPVAKVMNTEGGFLCYKY
ncbi:di-copper centre [Cordyceps militaris]|uniref:Di-copper centre n=1 Tax=Cordyceps militaris TaxID=73501 RepID=A0A2H4SCX5_CORMI|nr:di-copper centre [Cordyceps militaris]